MQLHKPTISIIMAIIVGILIFLFVIPKYQEFQDAKITLSKKQAEFNGESLYHGKISEIIQAISERKEVMDKVESSLPEESEIASLIYFFQKTSNETGLVIKSLTFADTPVSVPMVLPVKAGLRPKKAIKDVVFTINLSGGYQGLKSFLLATEKSARLFEVESIVLNPLQSGQTSALVKLPNYDFKLQVKTHTY